MPAFLFDWLEVLAGWPGAAYLHTSIVAYATLSAAHIFSLALVVGAIATLDLRVLGLFRAAPLGGLARPLTRVAATGLLLAAVTGFMLFSVRPLAYASNPAFLTKLTLVALGVANAVILRFNRHWQVAAEGGPTHGSIRLAACVSLMLWAGAILAGRWIGFLQ